MVPCKEQQYVEHNCQKALQYSSYVCIHQIKMECLTMLCDIAIGSRGAGRAAAPQKYWGREGGGGGGAQSPENLQGQCLVKKGIEAHTNVCDMCQSCAKS